MKKDWKFYLGVGLVIYSVIPYIVTLAMPLFGVSVETIAAVGAGLIISAELAFLAAVALLGRPFVDLIKGKIKAFFRRPVVAAAAPKPISRARHYIGIALLVASFVPYFASEGFLILGFTKERHINLIVGMLLSGDALFVVSLFVLGGEFWARLKKLFEWPGNEKIETRDLMARTEQREN